MSDTTSPNITLDQMEKMFQRFESRFETRFKTVEESVQGLHGSVMGFHGSIERLGERLRGVDEQFRGVNEQFRRVDEQFRGVNERLREMGEQLQGMGGGIRGIETRLQDVEANHRQLERWQSTHSSHLGSIADDVAALAKRGVQTEATSLENLTLINDLMNQRRTPIAPNPTQDGPIVRYYWFDVLGYDQHIESANHKYESIEHELQSRRKRVDECISCRCDPSLGNKVDTLERKCHIPSCTHW